MLLRLLMLIIWSKKIGKIEKKLDHAKCITTQKFNKLTAENLPARLKQANLATKADIHDFVKKTIFDNKLKNLNKNVTSNKSKQVLVEKN